MDEKPDEADLGGDRACWLDEVCPSCGGIDGHREGCEAAEVTREVGSADQRGRVAKDNEPSTVPPYVSRLTGGTRLTMPPVDPDRRDA
ncbi:MAG: hypothetical protein HY829_10265 [Actinobacteria bacterium]|nr:hypothetical protein [Actinomycetota bacterium]